MTGITRVKMLFFKTSNIFLTNLLLNLLAEMRVLATTLALLAQTTPISDPALLSNTFNALTNLAVLPAWHLDMKCALYKGYGLLDEGHWNIDGVSLLSLRFLINMSCNDEMIPSLLAAQVSF